MYSHTLDLPPGVEHLQRVRHDRQESVRGQDVEVLNKIKHMKMIE